MTHELQPSDIKEEDIKPMLAALRNDHNKDVKHLSGRQDRLEEELIEFARTNDDEHKKMQHADTQLDKAMDKLTQSVDRLAGILAPIQENKRDIDGFWSTIKKNKGWAAAVCLTVVSAIGWLWSVFHPIIEMGVKSWLKTFLGA